MQSRWSLDPCDVQESSIGQESVGQRCNVPFGGTRSGVRGSDVGRRRRVHHSRQSEIMGSPERAGGREGSQSRGQSSFGSQEASGSGAGLRRGRQSQHRRRSTDRAESR